MVLKSVAQSVFDLKKQIDITMEIPLLNIETLQKSKIIVISAPRLSGKTTLAKRIVYELRNYFDGGIEIATPELYTVNGHVITPNIEQTIFDVFEKVLNNQIQLHEQGIRKRFYIQVFNLPRYSQLATDEFLEKCEKYNVHLIVLVPEASLISGAMKQKVDLCMIRGSGSSILKSFRILYDFGILYYRSIDISNEHGLLSSNTKLGDSYKWLCIERSKPQKSIVDSFNYYNTNSPVPNINFQQCNPLDIEGLLKSVKKQKQIMYTQKCLMDIEFLFEE